MIIDFSEDPAHASQFDCVDLDSGQPLDVFYADDENGIYRVYLIDSAGKPYVDSATMEAAWEERRGRIKIMPVHESPRRR